MESLATEQNGQYICRVPLWNINFSLSELLGSWGKELRRDFFFFIGKNKESKQHRKPACPFRSNCCLISPAGSRCGAELLFYSSLFRKSYNKLWSEI